MKGVLKKTFMYCAIEQVNEGAANKYISISLKSFCCKKPDVRYFPEFEQIALCKDAHFAPPQFKRMRFLNLCPFLVLEYIRCRWCRPKA